MPGNFKRDDIRIVKTYKALTEALEALLDSIHFNQITVNDLCSQAQVSRTTFYTHFKDKYDLLEYWLNSIMPPDLAPHERIEKVLDFCCILHPKTFRNLIEHTSAETVALMLKYIASQVGPAGEESLDAVFCAGGVLNFLFWQSQTKTQSHEISKEFLALVHKFITATQEEKINDL